MEEKKVEELTKELTLNLLKKQREFLKQNKIKDAMAVTETLEQFANFCFYLFMYKIGG